MRIRILFFICVLLISTQAKAQDSNYPTLDALANLEIPSFDVLTLAGRFFTYNPSYRPPSTPPTYQVGDRETFDMPSGVGSRFEPMPMELRAMTDNVLIWVQDSAAYTRHRAQTLAERIEQDVLAPLQQLFQFAEPPGIDGDPRLTIAMMNNPNFLQGGMFPQVHTLPRELLSASNQREMLVASLRLDDRVDNFDDYLVEVIAHEYQHILLYHADYNEEIWLDEALASFAEHYTSGIGSGSDNIYEQANQFLEAPATALTNWQAVDDRDKKYGAGALFMIYLAERFGNDVITRLYGESIDGWRGIDKVLRQGASVSADEVFADWALANYFLNADGGYGYQALDSLLTPPQPLETLRGFPATFSSSLPQYSSDYLAVYIGGADQMSLRLTQAPEARLIDDAPIEGDYFYFAVTTDQGDSMLSREFDLTGVRQAWLEFKIWYDLEEGREYGYITISDDGGVSWTTLPGEHTTESRIYSGFFSDGYTGRSGGWLTERLDLSNYTPGRILLNFEVLSEIATSYGGMAIDDLRIDAIGFHDGFESADAAWVEEGWIRTDNRLPQRTWLQVVQDTAQGLRLDRHIMSATGDLTVNLLPDVSEVLVAISPVVPITSLETAYALEVNLLDADGNAIVRECTVTTTHALNFRAAPNGDKIGLLPQGATAIALDLREGWFKVEYNNQIGWISGGYVTTTGNCE